MTRRGFAGAPGSVPGTIASVSCWLRTPNGKTVNSSVHQMMTKIAVPSAQGMGGAYDDVRANCEKRMAGLWVVERFSCHRARILAAGWVTRILASLGPRGSCALHFHGFHADDGLLAPDVVGGASRGNADLLFELLAALAVDRTGNGVGYRFDHGLRNAFKVKHGIGSHPASAIEHQGDTDEAGISQRTARARDAVLLM